MLAMGFSWQSWGHWGFHWLTFPSSVSPWETAILTVGSLRLGWEWWRISMLMSNRHFEVCPAESKAPWGRSHGKQFPTDHLGESASPACRPAPFPFQQLLQQSQLLGPPCYPSSSSPSLPTSLPPFFPPSLFVCLSPPPAPSLCRNHNSELPLVCA